jgi:hypothetical protein
MQDILTKVYIRSLEKLALLVNRKIGGIFDILQSTFQLGKIGCAM